MNTITANKDELLATLRENRDEHRAIFEKALEVYRDRALAEFEAMVAEIRNGGKVRRHISLPEPEDHTGDFDMVIKMLEWETEKYVELTSQDVAQYIMNEWGWQRSFHANTESYLVQ